MSHTELKSLQVQRTKAREEMDVLNKEKASLDERLGTLKKQISALSQRIDAMTAVPAKIVISEHALLRYYERVEGLDVQGVVERLISPKTEEQIKKIGGTGKFPIGEINGTKVTLVLSKYVVTSLLTPKTELLEA